MSMEPALVLVLRTVCPRVFPDVAPAGTAAPYVTYQHIGGIPWRYLDNSPMERRHSSIQVNAWAATRAESLQLIRAVETALCAATAFQARPVAEPLGDVDETTDRRGSMQDFDIWPVR